VLTSSKRVYANLKCCNVQKKKYIYVNTYDLLLMRRANGFELGRSGLSLFRPGRLITVDAESCALASLVNVML